MSELSFAGLGWQTILPLVLGAVVMFWPKLKPFADGLLLWLNPKPTPAPNPTPADPLLDSVVAANRLAERFRSIGDIEGERLALETARALFPAPVAPVKGE